MQGIGFPPRQKRKALIMWLQDGVDIQKVCQKFKCCEMSLWRWKRKYDGTLESLANKSSRPHTPHPTSHTQIEREEIEKVLKSKPNISYNEAYGILRNKYAYTRSYGGFYNFVLRNGIRPRKEIEHYVPQPYDTPEMLGTKWQMDVKYVPLECNKVDIETKHRYYQYTMIDEATRERFLYPYKEVSAQATVNFVQRAIAYYGYAPETIQTDNGGEFTNPHHPADGKPAKKHALDVLLEKLNIKHKLIRPYTPRLNGKVERSHRSDQESFYNSLKFKTYEELKKKMLKWNIRYNNRPHSSLHNRDGKRVWWSPLQKRADLLNLLQEKKEEYNAVRFILNQKTIKQVYAI